MSLASGGCELDTEADVSLGAYEEPLWSGTQPSIDYDGCSPSQEQNLNGALLVLRGLIHPSYRGNEYLACLKDAVTNTAWDRGRTPEQIYRFSNAPGELEIGCQDLDPPKWGQANIDDGGQEIELDNRQVDRIRVNGALDTWQELGMAGVIVHELLHVAAGGGQNHPKTTGTRDYDTTVNRIAQDCAVGRSARTSRSAIGGKVDLAWVGGGRPFNVSSADLVSSVSCADHQAVMGLTVSQDLTTVYSVGIRCAAPTATAWSASTISERTGLGSQGGTVARLSCRSDSMATALSVRFRGDGAQARLEQLGGTCVPVSQIRSPAAFSTVTFLGPWGGTTGEAAHRACPAGRVLVGVRGHLRGTARQVQALQPICRPIAEVGRRERQAVAAGTAVGGSGGAPSVMRCPGNSIAVGMIGGAGRVVDRLGLVCADHDINNPNRLGTAYSISDVVGGQTEASFERWCNHPDLPETAVVGLELRAGSVIDRVQPVCAVPSAWRAGSRDTFLGLPAGGDGGGRFVRMCPQGRFVVGLNARSGASVDRLQVLCSDQSSPKL